jgi:hypothetical protein
VAGAPALGFAPPPLSSRPLMISSLILGRGSGGRGPARRIRLAAALGEGVGSRSRPAREATVAGTEETRPQGGVESSPE